MNKNAHIWLKYVLSINHRILKMISYYKLYTIIVLCYIKLYYKLYILITVLFGVVLYNNSIF